MLPRSFYQKPTLTVAKNLIGKIFQFHDFSGIIIETEAYIGQDDPACHAAKGLTKRTWPMFEEGGISYIYLIYGMYYCFNVVTEEKNYPAAVLIRGVKMQTPHIQLLDGPGKLCRAYGLTKNHNAQDLTINPAFSIQESSHHFSIKATPRIGISKGQAKLWRFIAVENNPT